MKKFKFRLQNVLDAREKALENAQLAMAKVQARLNKALEHLENLYKCLNKTKLDLEFLLDSGKNLDFTIVNCHQAYIIKLETDIKNQHKIISDIEVELEDKKKEVLEALKAKTILEKLKEKDIKAFNAEFERVQMVEIDEIATNRHKKSNSL